VNVNQLYTYFSTHFTLELAAIHTATTAEAKKTLQDTLHEIKNKKKIKKKVRKQ
jgi:hypothetical protein